MTYLLRLQGLEANQIPEKFPLLLIQRHSINDVPIAEREGQDSDTTYHIHKVKSGEFLWTIARIYYPALTDSEIKALVQSIRIKNNLSDDALQVGQNLQIPVREGFKIPQEETKTEEKYSDKSEVIKEAKKKKDKTHTEEIEYNDTALQWLKYLDKQKVTDQEILNAIKENRKKVPDHADKMKPYKAGNVYWGKKETKPSTLDEVSPVQKFIWQELAGEGGDASINIWDDQIFTWGRGFAATGDLTRLLSILLNDNPDINRLFNLMGMTIVNGQLRLVDSSTGIIHSGSSDSKFMAYKLIKETFEQGNSQLISFFIEIGENEMTRQEVMDAQFKTVMTGHVGNVPDFVYDNDAKKYKENWSDESASLVAHLSHWLPGGAWGYAHNHKYYKESKGSTLKVLIAYCLAQSANGYNTVVRPYPNGSHEFFGFNPTWGGHLEKFAGGAGLREIQKVCSEPLSISEEDRRTNEYYKNHIFIAAKGNKFYVIPIDGSVFIPEKQ